MHRVCAQLRRNSPKRDASRLGVFVTRKRNASRLRKIPKRDASRLRELFLQTRCIAFAKRADPDQQFRNLEYMQSDHAGAVQTTFCAFVCSPFQDLQKSKMCKSGADSGQAHLRHRPDKGGTGRHLVDF